MNTLSKVLSKYKFFLILLLCDAVLWGFQPDLSKKSLTLSCDYFLEMLSVVPPVFILMGLMDVWVPKETMMKYMGKGAGLKGGIFAFLLGSFSSGPLYAAFPIAGMFLKKGASLANVFLFLGAWSTTKIPMMLFEATQLGSRFTLIRFCLNIVGIIVLAFIIEKTTGRQELETLEQKISEALQE